MLDALIFDFEEAYSRFKKNSHISLLNKNKILEASDEFLDILTIGQDAFQKSG
jgi:hypothetical protein